MLSMTLGRDGCKEHQILEIEVGEAIAVILGLWASLLVHPREKQVAERDQPHRALAM